MEIYLLCSHRPLAAISPLKKFKLHLRANGSDIYDLAGFSGNRNMRINMSVQGIFNTLMMFSKSEELFNNKHFSRLEEIEITFQPERTHYIAGRVFRGFLEETEIALDISIFDLTELKNTVRQTYTKLIPQGSTLTIASCCYTDLFKVIFDTDSFKYCGNVYYNGSCESRSGLSGTFLFNDEAEYIELKRYLLLNQLLRRVKV